MIEDVDLRILNLLLENSRLSYRKIAARLGISVATVMNHVNDMEKKGIIKKYTAALDYEKLGYDVSVLVDLRISKGKLFEVEREIAKEQNVRAIFDITGAFDAQVFAMFKTREQLDKFLKRIQTYEFIERTETKLILNRMKDDIIKVA